MNDSFELKNIAFMLILMRVIMSAAFATSKTKDIAEAIALVRKSSSAPDEPNLERKLSRKNSVSKKQST